MRIILRYCKHGVSRLVSQAGTSALGLHAPLQTSAQRLFSQTKRLARILLYSQQTTARTYFNNKQYFVPAPKALTFTLFVLQSLTEMTNFHPLKSVPESTSMQSSNYRYTVQLKAGLTYN